MNTAATDSPATVDQVLALVRQHATPLESMRVPLNDAAGRILREPVLAPEDQPAFDRSAMDGYAVGLHDNSSTFQIVDHLRAGDWKPRQLQTGQAVQIATGAALPSDNLQVIIKEDIRLENNRIVVLQRDAKRNIRFRGEDAQAGTELIKAGTRLQPGSLALLASIGCAQPLVTRSIHVLHLVTGNEIVAPDHQPAPGQIRDCNSTLVRAFLGEFGIVPEQHYLSEEECMLQSGGVSTAAREDARPTNLRQESGFGIRLMASGETSPDLVLISGGASVGEHDFTRPLLEHLGFTIHVHRTTTRPGKPLIFATRGQTLAFGLPGNPLAHFVCLNLYVRAALLGLSGSAQVFEFIFGTLASDFVADSHGRETLWPARLGFREGRAELSPLPWRSSGDITSLATVNALVRIPPGSSQLSRGAPLQFISTANI